MSEQTTQNPADEIVRNGNRYLRRDHVEKILRENERLREHLIGIINSVVDLRRRLNEKYGHPTKIRDTLNYLLDLCSEANKALNQPESDE